MSQQASHPDCIFCKIVSGTIPAARLYEDEHSIAFADINPQAPTHILVIPRRHVASHAHLPAEDVEMMGYLLSAVGKIAADHKLTNGYRVVMNTGDDGGQTVDHLHLHLLGGRHMTWPPG